jgi:8-oxo-dGTP diphosphatase
LAFYKEDSLLLRKNQQNVMKVRVADIICEQNKILLLHYNYSGTEVYTLPGGNLEFGEEMRECLERELDEELLIKTEIGKEPVMSGDVHLKGVDTLHILYEANILEGKLEINKNETTADGFKWVDLDSLSELNLYPSVSGALKKWKSNSLEEAYLGEIKQKYF